MNRDFPTWKELDANLTNLEKGRQPETKVGVDFWTIYVSLPINLHTGTVSGAIFDGFLEVFWIFLKNEHGKLKFTLNRPALDESELS